MTNKIKEIIENIHPNAFSEGDKLVTDEIIDSVDIMNIVSALEDCFKIEFEPDDISSENFDTVSAIAKVVEKNMHR